MCIRDRVKEAAACLKLTAQDLLQFGVIERMIEEPKGNFEPVYHTLKTELHRSFFAKKGMPIEELLAKRYERFRKIGGNQP